MGAPLAGGRNADALARGGHSAPELYPHRRASRSSDPVAERRAGVRSGFDLFAAAGALIDCWNSILERGVLPAGLDALNAAH